jgi:hypothetical protein
MSDDATSMVRGRDRAITALAPIVVMSHNRDMDTNDTKPISLLIFSDFV